MELGFPIAEVSSRKQGNCQVFFVTKSGAITSNLFLMELAAPPTSTQIDPPPLPEKEPIIKSKPGFRRFIAKAFDGLFGILALILALAVISAVPILNLLSLGYLLEASRRVAVSGKIRSGFVGIGKATVLGKIILCTWLWSIPIRLVHTYWQDAELIKAGSKASQNLKGFLIFLIIAVTLHLIWACIRGGKLRHFFWPAPVRFIRWLGETGEFARIWNKIFSFAQSLRLSYYLNLGFKGFAGAAIWLVIPVLILMAASVIPNVGLSAITSLLGAILLGIVVLYLPFLQTHFAVSGNFREFFSIKSTRQSFRRAPLAFWMALFITLLFAIPLYLLKIELTPNEVAWLPNLVFVLFIFPARILVGWAVGRSMKREQPRIWVSRWISRLAAIPVVAAYVFVVWLTQYLSWHGSYGLLEQHAFLVPAPLLGL